MGGKKEKKYKESDVMVLLESMNNGIEIIAESQQQLRSDMGELKSDVAILKTDVAVLKTDVAVLKTDMVEVKSELSEIKYKLDRKVSYEDFEKLEKRVFKLENASA